MNNTDLFEQIDQINWSHLTDSTGRPATNVGDLLKNVLEKDLHPTDNKRRFLREAIAGEYNVGTATLAAVPIMVEALKRDDTPNKDCLLRILSEAFQYGPEDNYLRTPYMLLALKVADEIIKGLDIYIQLLEDPNPIVRSFSIYLITRHPFPKQTWNQIEQVYLDFKEKEVEESVREHFMGIEKSMIKRRGAKFDTK